MVDKPNIPKDGAAQDMIPVPSQFETPRDSGYVRTHAAFTETLTKLAPRTDIPAELAHADTLEFSARQALRKSEERKEEFHHQACENVARRVLLHDATITQLPRQQLIDMVAAEYSRMVQNPDIAAASRASAVH